MAEYSPNLCKLIKDHGMGGKSWISFSATQDITMRKLLDWAKAYPEFNEALEISQAHSLNFWEEKAIEAVEEGNNQLLSLARFKMDEAYSIYEKIYGKKVSGINPVDLVKKQIGNYNETDRNRDVLAEMLRDDK